MGGAIHEAGRLNPFASANCLLAFAGRWRERGGPNSD